MNPIAQPDAANALPPLPPPPGTMTMQEAVDDVMAQLADLRADGAAQLALAAALVREGLPELVAMALTAPAFTLPADAELPEVAGHYGVDLAEVRRLLRLALPHRGVDRLAPSAPQTALSVALQRAGVAPAVAVEAAQVLTDQVQAEYDVKLRRLRRLGQQAMGFGVVFAAFFAYAGAQPEPGSRWHWMTSVMALGIALYGAAVFRRANQP